MTVPDNTVTTVLELTLAEEWVVHHVMLEAVGLARPEEEPDEDPPECILNVIEKLEANRYSFTALELDHVRHACEVYADSDSVPDADRRLASRVVERIDERVEDGAFG